jgi:hypothetical protein
MGLKVTPRSDWEHSLYVLAEKLHTPVYVIRREMPMSEFMGWLRYYAPDQSARSDGIEFSADSFGALKDALQ